MLSKEAQQEFDELMGLAAHDLVEPVRKIQVFGSRLQQMLEEKGDIESKVILQKILDNAEGIHHLVHQLHTFSRIHRKAEAPQRVELSFVLQSLLQENDSFKEIQIDSGPLPAVQMSFTHARELLFQLLDNVLRFKRVDTKPQLNIGWETINKDGQECLQLTFSDNGIGISPSDAVKILSPFIRLHSRQTYGGAGLGLAIAEQIMKHYKGEIQANGNGQGTNIYIYLPKNIIAE